MILNQAGSPRHAAEVAGSIDLPVLGTLAPRRRRRRTRRATSAWCPPPSASEAAHALDALAERIAEDVDLDAVLAARRDRARPRRRAVGPGARGHAPPASRQPVVAVAGGRAFTFRYAETEELLRAAGCRVGDLRPARRHRPARRAPPASTSAAASPRCTPPTSAATRRCAPTLRDGDRGRRPDRRRVRRAALPVPHVDDAADGRRARGRRAAMTARLTLRYPTRDRRRRLAADPGRRDGHRPRVPPHPRRRRPPGRPAPGAVDGEPVGFASATLHASYLHTHWAGHPQLAQRFADAVPRAMADTSHARCRDDAAASRDHRRRRTRCATTATSRSATPGCSTSRSTCTPGRARTGSSRRCATASTTSAATRPPTAAEAAVAERHGRDPRRGAGDGRRRRGVRPGRPGPAVAAAGRRAPAVHRAARRARAGRPPGHRGACSPQPRSPSTRRRPGRRRPRGRRQPDQPDRRAAPGRRSSARCCGRAGWSSSTRRSWTPCPASPSRWPATPGCW